MKKIISTGLVLFILLTLSISVFAVDLPRNEFVGSATLTDITVTDSTQSYSVTPNTECSFGTFNYFNLYLRRNTSTSQDITGVGIHIEVPVSINTQSTIYVAVSPIDSNFSISLPFESYAYPDGDISVTLPAGTYNSFNAYLELRYSDDFTNFDTSSYSSNNSVDVVFRCFKDVPPTPLDTPYLVTYSADDKPSYDNHHDWIFPISFYISIPTIFDDFENGNITFNEAINDIQSNLDDVLDSPTATDSQKLVALGVAENDIERIKQISDIKYNSVVSNFGSNADIYISNFQNGLTSLDSTLNSIGSDFVTASSSAVSPEQAEYLATVYQTKLSKLHLLWEVDFQQKLEEVISDSDLSNSQDKLLHLDDLYASEQEAMEAFKDFDLSTLIDLNEWALTMGDYTSYRDIFNAFFEGNSLSNSSVISMCVTLPFTLIIVSIILGTSSVVFSFVRRDKE